MDPAGEKAWMWIFSYRVPFSEIKTVSAPLSVFFVSYWVIISGNLQ